MIILMKTILELLLVLGLWPDVIELNNVTHAKRDRQRTNPYSMVSNKSAGFVYGNI